jgi:poly(A) polymerase
MIRYRGAFYRIAGHAEAELERLLLALLPPSPFREQVFAVGGYVRDQVMGKDSKDLDVVVERKEGAKAFAYYLHDMFPAETSRPLALGAGYPIWHIAFQKNIKVRGDTFKVAGAELDIADSQKEAFPDPDTRQRVTTWGTIDEDVERRDFTVNMLLRDLTTGEIIDLSGTGVKDIQDGILRTHPHVSPDKMFSDDPLRMLRLVRFMVKYGWRVDLKMKEAVRRNAHRIEIVSGERIQGELVKIANLGKLALALRFMTETGLTGYIMPEIDILRGVQQSPEHHSEGDVYEHTMLVLEKAAPNIHSQLAALFHDAGKPATQEFLGDSIHFYGHEVVSGEIAEAIMRRLKFDSKTIQKVRRIVESHMRAHTALEWTGKAVRKFVRDVAEDLEDILHLTEIDALSSHGPGMIPGDNPIPRLRERIKEVQQIPVSSKPLLSGHDIMKTLGIPPGAEIGRVQQWIQEKVDDLASSGVELTREDALRLLAEEYA